MTLAERIYRRVPTVLVARRNLSRTTARTLLATLGIVIGVVAIASLGVLGTTLQTAAVGSLGDIGNELVVSPHAEADVESLTERDVRDIRRVSGDATVVPVKQSTVTVEYANQRARVQTYGIDDPGATYNASDGTIPGPLRSGALVGSALAELLEIRPGSSIVIENRTFRVRAVLEEQAAFSPVSVNSAVILPESAVNETGYSQVVVSAESGQAANATAQAIRAELNDREERVSIFELGQFTESIGEFFEVLNLFLIGVGSLSLLVAGISILNVMLMSTIERREEIGVLRAVGYQRRDVLKIMLSEALLLGIAGGVVGVLLSLGVGGLIGELAIQDPGQVFAPRSLLYLGLAFVFGVGTSVLSGLYPAWKAAREHPVDALRD